MTIEEALAASEAEPVTDDDMQFWIDEHLRVISIPKNGVVAGVEGDKNVNKIKFGMNRYYHGFDMSELSGRILYSNAKGNKNYYNITDMQTNGNTITFSWLVDADAVQYMGKTAFVVYLFKIQGSELRQKFFSTLATLKVLEGMEVDSAVPVEKQTDIIERMKEEISAYAEEVKKSLPADYTAMTEQVNSLKEDLVDKTNSLKEDLDTLNQGGLNLKEDFIGTQINEWLNEHPEATTTVQDKSIGENKLTEKLNKVIRNNFYTPEMFGAVGDGVTDDSQAFIEMFNLSTYVNNITFNLKSNTTYYIKSPLHCVCGRGIGSTKIFGNGAVILSDVVTDEIALKLTNLNNMSVVRDLTIKYAGISQGTIGLYVSSETALENVKVDGFTKYCFYLNTPYTTHKNLKCEHSNYNSIKCDDDSAYIYVPDGSKATNITMLTCSIGSPIYSVVKYGFYLGGLNNVLVACCPFGSGKYGFYINGRGNIIISPYVEYGTGSNEYLFYFTGQSALNKVIGVYNSGTCDYKDEGLLNYFEKTGAYSKDIGIVMNPNNIKEPNLINCEENKISLFDMSNPFPSNTTFDGEWYETSITDDRPEFCININVANFNKYDLLNRQFVCGAFLDGDYPENLGYSVVFNNTFGKSLSNYSSAVGRLIEIPDATVQIKFFKFQNNVTGVYRWKPFLYEIPTNKTPLKEKFGLPYITLTENGVPYKLSIKNGEITIT